MNFPLFYAKVLQLTLLRYHAILLTLVHCDLCYCRFLGLPEMQRIVDADSHQTGDKDIQAHHKLNQTTRCLLAEFYRPFNILLEELLNETLAYDDYTKNCA